MNTPTMDAATQARLEKLEQFKTEIEKKLFAAGAVATVLGVASIIGGVWIRDLTGDLADLTGDLAELSTKTEKLRSDSTQLDQQIASSITKLNNEKIHVLSEIDSRVKSVNTQLSQESEKVISQQQKRLEASHSSSKDLIAKLSNGSLSLVVRGIQIRNSQGNIAAVLTTDEEGGFLGINTNKGKQRYAVGIFGKGAPQAYFFNPNGKLVLSAGVYDDGSGEYMRFWNMSGETKLLELATDKSKGGFLSSYSTNGKAIVYLGPDSNTGNGLVNVYGISGKAISSSLAAKNYDLQQQFNGVLSNPALWELPGK